MVLVHAVDATKFLISFSVHLRKSLEPSRALSVRKESCVREWENKKVCFMTFRIFSDQTQWLGVSMRRVDEEFGSSENAVTVCFY